MPVNIRKTRNIQTARWAEGDRIGWIFGLNELESWTAPRTHGIHHSPATPTPGRGRGPTPIVPCGVLTLLCFRTGSVSQISLWKMEPGRPETVHTSVVSRYLPPISRNFELHFLPSKPSSETPMMRPRMCQNTRSILHCDIQHRPRHPPPTFFREDSSPSDFTSAPTPLRLPLRIRCVHQTRSTVRSPKAPAQTQPSRRLPLQTCCGRVVATCTSRDGYER